MPRPVRSFSMPYGAAFGAPRAGGRRRHEGADYHAPTWTPIYGVADGGRVAHIGANMDPQLGLGHNVTIVYPGGIKTLDGHMVDRTPLSYGQTVNTDTIVGYVGQTGNAVNGSPPGPHDHHMRWHHGILVDPETVYANEPAAHDSTPITPPLPDFPEEEAMKTIQSHYTRPDGRTGRIMYVPGTPWYIEWTEPGATLANDYARALETGSSVPIDPSMVKQITDAAARCAR